jgi:asparagine synthase (glutamine-hydrolysing)
MTAIFGTFGTRTSSSDRLRLMADASSSRCAGPARILTHSRGALGQRRANAARDALPERAEARQIEVVLDGVIYNARTLREGLESAHREAAGPGDEDLIRALYERAGSECIRDLRGRFAVAIWDGRTAVLVLARDHVGHKPLFYSEKDGELTFASNLGVLLAAGVVPFAVDTESLSHFLSLRFVPPPRSLVKGISKVAPAQIVLRDDRRTATRQYWSLSFANKLAISEHDAVDALEGKLRETVAAHLEPTERAGSFLSAGLDSGLIVATIAGILRKPFHTFSLGVANASDEIPAARIVAKKFGTIQHEAYPDDDVVRLLPAMIWELQEPSDPVVVSKFFAAKLAAPHVDAAMSGDGGDELFAGFKRYLGVRDAQYFGYLPAFVRDRVIGSLARAFGGRSVTSFAGKIEWLTAVSRAGGIGERYAEAVAYLRFRRGEKRELFSDTLWREVGDVDSNRILSDTVSRSDADDPIEKLLSADFATRLPEHLLMLDDRTGAAHGVDIVCPLADKELAELGASIPANFKIKGREAKYIQRKLAARTLPSEIVNYKKTGWSFPFSELCANRLQPFLRSVFSASRLVEHGLLRESYLQRIVAEHGSRQVDHHIRIWMLLSLEIWYRMMADGQRHEALEPWLEKHLAAT